MNDNIEARDNLMREIEEHIPALIAVAKAAESVYANTQRFFDEQWSCGCNGGWCTGECGGNPRTKLGEALTKLKEVE